MLSNVVEDSEWRDDGNESYWRRRRPLINKCSIAGILRRELSRIPRARNAALMNEGAVEMKCHCDVPRWSWHLTSAVVSGV